MDMQVRNATLAERNRIAREIHDNVGHQLTRAVVQLQAISVINQDEKTKPYLECPYVSDHYPVTAVLAY